MLSRYRTLKITFSASLFHLIWSGRNYFIIQPTMYDEEEFEPGEQANGTNVRYNMGQSFVRSDKLT